MDDIKEKREGEKILDKQAFTRSFFPLSFNFK